MLLGMLTCKESLRQLDDYIDRELTPEEIVLVERHLRICRACRRKFAAEAEFVHQVRRVFKKLAVPDGLMGRISATLSQERANQAEEGS